MNLHKFSSSIKQDRIELINMLKDLFDSNSHEYTSVLNTYLANITPTQFFYFFKDKGNIIGFVAIHSWRPIPKPDKLERLYWHIANIHLLKEYRGKGLGKSFVSEIILLAKKSNVEKIITFAGGDFGEFMKECNFTDKHTILLLKP